MKTDFIINNDALCGLKELPSDSVNCCVTSPPYYGMEAQIGREETPEQYIERLVDVFHELFRVYKQKSAARRQKKKSRRTAALSTRL